VFLEAAPSQYLLYAHSLFFECDSAWLKMHKRDPGEVLARTETLDHSICPDVAGPLQPKHEYISLLFLLLITGLSRIS
jgi:hypothetical protein